MSYSASHDAFIRGPGKSFLVEQVWFPWKDGILARPAGSWALLAGGRLESPVSQAKASPGTEASPSASRT